MFLFTRDSCFAISKFMKLFRPKGGDRHPILESLTNSVDESDLARVWGSILFEFVGQVVDVERDD